MLKVIATLLLLVLSSAYNEQNGVLNLTEADFPQVFTDYPYLFVKFYTPWCGHCKELAPVFIQLAAQIKTIHPEIKFADVDIEANKALQSKYEINGFPTLIYFKQGKQIKYEGSRELQVFHFWLHKKTIDPIVPVGIDQLAALETDGRVNIVFYGDLNSPKAEILKKISAADDFNMYYQVKSSQKPNDSIEIFRPFAKSVQNNVIDGNIKNWIALFDRPFVYPFNDRASGEIFQNKRNAVFLFVPDGQNGAKVRQTLLAAAADWKIHLKRRLVFTQIQRTEKESFDGFSDYLKINPDKNFLVFVKSAEKLKYLYNGSVEETTKEKIIEFIKSVEEKKIKPLKFDQETRPKSAQPTQTQTTEQL